MKIFQALLCSGSFTKGYYIKKQRNSKHFLPSACWKSTCPCFLSMSTKTDLERFFTLSNIQSIIFLLISEWKGYTLKSQNSQTLKRWKNTAVIILKFEQCGFTICGASSEFVSSSIPSWQILTAHAQPFREARDLVFCLNVPLDSMLVWASSGGSGETAWMRRLAWTFAASIGDKYQIRLTRLIW